MKNLLLSTLLVLSFVQVAFGELNVEVVKTQVMTGLVNPKVVNSFVMYESEGSAPKVTPAALIKVTSDYKFTRVRARQNLFESGQVSKLSDTEYLLLGPGKFAIEVTAFDPEKGIDDKLVPIDLGESPEPEPEPGPDPDPTPLPIPDDEFNNLAKRIFSLAKDLPKRKDLAKVYSDAAKVLTENPSSTINSVAVALVDQRAKVLGNDLQAYNTLINTLNEDLKSRWPISRNEFAKYLQIVALGLGA